MSRAEHLLVLTRRRDYLIDQIRERGDRPGYDFRKAEKDALDWALQQLDINAAHCTPLSDKPVNTREEDVWNVTSPWH